MKYTSNKNLVLLSNMVYSPKGSLPSATPLKADIQVEEDKILFTAVPEEGSFVYVHLTNGTILQGWKESSGAPTAVSDSTVEATSVTLPENEATPAS